MVGPTVKCWMPSTAITVSELNWASCASYRTTGFSGPSAPKFGWRLAFRSGITPQNPEGQHEICCVHFSGGSAVRRVGRSGADAEGGDLYHRRAGESGECDRRN